MITLKILKIEEFNRYVLISAKTSKLYSLVLEFYNMETPKKDCYIEIDERLLDPYYEDYCQPYAFEPTTEKDFCAILTLNDKKIYLRRIYG